MSSAGFPKVWMRAVCGGWIPSVLALYAPHAVLVPTFSQSILRGKRELEGYFRKFMSKTGLCGTIDSVIEQGRGQFRVLSGIYTFRWRDKGRQEMARARFTYVLSLDPKGEWKIINHHSSAMPDEQ